MSKNMNIFDKGMQKMLAMIEKHLIVVGKDLAIYALMRAVDAYDKDSDTQNLTGNTRTGFVSAAFYNGKIIGGPYVVMDFGIDPPTSGFVKVGSRGFRDYDDGVWIGSEADPAVRDYSNPDLYFAETIVGSKAYEITESWVRSNYKPPKRGMSIVVANRSSYVNFLRDFRNFDILETESDISEIKNKIRTVLSAHPFNSIN